jgi:magnesium-transporting ATPase (P-type)
VTTFILAGRYFEARSKRRAGAALKALLELGAKDVVVLRDGVETRIPTDQLDVGDLFVVRPASADEETPAWRSQVERLIDEVRSWTGNHVAVIEQAEPEASSLRRSRRPVLNELRRDGIDLAGTPLRELLGTSR